MQFVAEGSAQEVVGDNPLVMPLRQSLRPGEGLPRVGGAGGLLVE